MALDIVAGFGRQSAGIGVGMVAEAAAFSAFTTKVLAAAVEQGLLALPRVFFSSFDKSVHNKVGGGEGDAWAFKLS